jgi:hypothetical protein
MTTFSYRSTFLPASPKLLPLCLLIAGWAPLFSQPAEGDEINLGSANNFAVLAGSTVTNTGATVVGGGDVGVAPGSAITGFPPGVITAPYTIHSGDGPALTAEADLTTAYNAAAALAPTQILTGTDLGGLTLTPGVYFFASSAQLTGNLTLNAEGNPDAVFVFQIGSTLTTASDSSVMTINDDGSLTPGISTFWQIGSSATLGTDTAFEGNILALASITANTGAADLDGRFLARNGAVTLDDNAIMAPPAEGSGISSVPDAGGTESLFGFGLGALLLLRQRKTS